MVAGLALVDRPERPDQQGRAGGKRAGRPAWTPPPPADWPLVGRGDDLARIDATLGAGHSIVVVGEAGVGKSRLIAGWIDQRADVSPSLVAAPLVVRATRSTATIPFGAFARWVPERHRPHDRLGLFQATAANLLAGTPDPTRPALVVDDGQLLDDGSAALLLHLAQHAGVQLLVAVRAGEPCPDAVVALWKDGLADRLDLAPLDRHATGELARRALGGRRLEASAGDRLWQLTQGNPLYLREVLDAARDQGVLALRADRWRWEGDLAGRGRLDDLVGDRLLAAAGSPGERRALELVALGEPLPVDVLARLVPPGLLAAAERRDLLVEERTSADPAGPVVRLAHPLYAEVLRAGLPRSTARHRHGELARAAVAAGLHHRDPLRVATWQLAGDDPGDPDLLLRAAHVAFIVDEPDLSVRLAGAAEEAGAGWPAELQRAAALGPAGRWEEADAVLAALSRPGRPQAARVAATRVRVEGLVWHRGEPVAEARAVVAQELATLPGEARSPLLTLAARLAFADLDLAAAGTLATAAATAAGTTTAATAAAGTTTATATTAAGVATAAGTTTAGATTVAAAGAVTGDGEARGRAERLHALSCAAVVAAFRGHGRAVVDLVAAAAPHAAALAADDPVPAGFLIAAYSFAAPLAGRVDEAATLFAGLRDHEVLTTYRSLRAFPALGLARAQLAQGRVGAAAALAHEVLTSMIGDENHYGRGNWVAATLASAAGQAGDAATAAEALAWIEDHRPFPMGPDTLGLDLGRVWLYAARGETSDARALALAVADRSRAAGCGLLEATALIDAARLGAAAEAAGRLAELADELGGGYLAAAAGFARGQVMGDGNGLDAAADGFAAAGARLLAAEAATAAAEAHGAAGRRRHEAATRARALRWAGECDGAATPLLRRLAQEPPAAALTRREREVAELAARGRSNREIAEALHVSRRTVDSHLDHAYTKLGITTRHELPSALGLTPLPT